MMHLLVHLSFILVTSIKFSCLAEILFTAIFCCSCSLFLDTISILFSSSSSSSSSLSSLSSSPLPLKSSLSLSSILFWSKAGLSVCWSRVWDVICSFVPKIEQCGHLVRLGPCWISSVLETRILYSHMFSIHIKIR